MPPAASTSHARPDPARQASSRRRRPWSGAAVTVGATLTLAACASAPPAESTTGTSAASQTGPGSSAHSPAPPAPTSHTSTRPTARTPAASTPTCAERLVGPMSSSERAGQLLMVGLDSGARRTSVDRLVAARHLGGVILLGGWAGGVDEVSRTTRHLASLAGPRTAGLGLLVAADQEGGAVQQLRGRGFSTIPSAGVQGRYAAATLRADAKRWATQLARAGINVNLAPVADTVPAALGRANDPIGRHDREFSSDPRTNARMVSAFVSGTRAGGVASTVKHFPGLGRVTGNTDLTTTGITDRSTTVKDAYLGPFTAGIKAGSDLVMVSSAIYSRIDPRHNAVFSRAIVTDLLRKRLGYDGVVITDDVGAAKSVSAVPAGERATRFVAAGGDIVLTARADTVPAMHDALVRRMATDAAFARQVQSAVTRVVELKMELGLARCP